MQEQEESNLQEESSCMLNIPQGFYGVITPESDKSIKGLFTDGLGPCACLIITDSKRNYIFLAHVDGKGMNLGDKELGIVSWINKIKEYDKNLQILIHCGEGFQYGVKEKIDYEREIKQILLANKELNYLIDNVKMYKTDRKISASLIFRNGISNTEYDNIAFDLNGEVPCGIEDKLNELGFKIIDFMDPRAWRNDYLGYQKDELEDAINDRETIGTSIKLKYEVSKTTSLPFFSTEQDTTLPFPPVCCFDGVESFLETDPEVVYKKLDNKYKNVIDKYKSTMIQLHNRGANTYASLRKSFNEEYNGIVSNVALFNLKDVVEVGNQEVNSSISTVSLIPTNIISIQDENGDIPKQIGQ